MTERDIKYDPTNQAIITYLSQGLTLKEIAGKVYLSDKSVKYRIKMMKKSSGAKNIIELILKAIKNAVPGVYLHS